MKRLQLTLLGDFKAQISGHRVEIRSSKAKALLAYVALSRGQSRSRSELLALLWSDRGEEQARRSLRQELTMLRRALGDKAPLLVDRETVALASPHTTTDVARLERLANGESDAARPDDGLPPQGELLSGLLIRDPAFDEWLAAERRRVETLAIRAHTQLLAAQRHAADLDAVRQTATQLLALDSLNENAHRALMETYVATGERNLALAAYETLHDRLDEELGVSPEPETEALYEAIRERNGESPNASTETSDLKAVTYGVPAPGAEQPRYGHRAYARERHWFGVTAAGLIVVASAVAYVVWSEWQERERHFAAQAKAFEAELEQAALEKRHLAEEAELVTVKLKTEAEARRQQERAALERALAELEQALALKEIELARLDEAHRQAERERALELEHMRASVAERDARLSERMMALETERLRLERARLELEAARATAEAEQQAELERLQREEARRQADVEREREALVAARRAFDAERAQTEAERREEIAHIRAEEAAKRAVLQRERDELVRQRDELLLRLSQLEPQLANQDRPILPAMAADASTQPVDELTALEAWRKSEATIQRRSAVLESTRAPGRIELEPTLQGATAWQPHRDIIDYRDSNVRVAGYAARREGWESPETYFDHPALTAPTAGSNAEVEEVRRRLGASSQEAGIKTPAALAASPYKVAIVRSATPKGRTGSTNAGVIERRIVRELTSFVEGESSIDLAYHPYEFSGEQPVFRDAWVSGRTEVEPNMPVVTRGAQALNVRVAVMVWFKPRGAHDTRNTAAIVVYVIDVKDQKICREEGLVEDIRDLTAACFSNFLQPYLG